MIKMHGGFWTSYSRMFLLLIFSYGHISTLLYIALNLRLCSCVAQLLSCKKTTCNAFETVLSLYYTQ